MREGPIGRDTETQGRVDGDRCAGSSPGARSSVRKMESPKRQRPREGPARSQGRGALVVVPGVLAGCGGLASAGGRAGAGPEASARF